MTVRAFYVAVALVLAPALAHADDPFASARHVKHLDDIVWPYTTACDKGDDTQQRQCRFVRDRELAALRGTTLLVEADPEAFTTGAWDAAKKSATLSLSGCIRCAGQDVDGKSYKLVAASTATRVEGGALRAAPLYDTARAFDTADAAAAYAKQVASHRVELLVRIPEKKGAPDPSRPFVLDVIGYRVITPCDGAVIFALPESPPLPPDKTSCAK
jgi:hypothetical protein